jgi:hypothetical protein
MDPMAVAPLVIIAALLLSACSETPRPFTDFDTLTVEQSACLFDCPAFEVAIHADGRVRHSGPTFDSTGGPVDTRISRDGLAQIAQALRAARIEEMRDSYRDETEGCEHVFSDMSTLGVTVRRGRGQRNKSVELYAGCLGANVPTERFDALIKAIDRVTGTGRLLDQRKQKKTLDGTTVAPSK